MRAQAESGASGGDIGVAGSVAISVANLDNRAVVGMNTGTATPDAAVIVLTGGQTDIHAEGVNESLVRAAPSGVTGGAEGGSVGVGASFALNILLADTIGEVEDGEDVSGTTGHFLVTADTTSDVITEAENGASGGGTSIGASIAIAVVENTTRAHIGSDPGGTITLAYDLSTEASLDSTVITTGSGRAAGKNAAVGVAVALNIVTNTTSAELEQSFSGAHNVDVTSHTDEVSSTISRASASGASSDSNGDEDGGTASKNSEEETNSQSNYATGRSGTSNKFTMMPRAAIWAKRTRNRAASRAIPLPATARPLPHRSPSITSIRTIRRALPPA
ncbi:hypothetical protein LP420_40200 [Massilia sp. B-10]|nr:hypothetical protein LP420_40200 [Massilia sp. B-10]